jgi:hypothetical protein
MERITDIGRNAQSRIEGLFEQIIRRSFLQYLALFTISWVLFFLFFHYCTTWFNTSDTTKDTMKQAGVALALSLAVCAIAFFTKML